MSEKRITFFPVGNGQAVLVTLDEDTHLLFDLLQRPEEDDRKEVDVHSELLAILPVVEDCPHLSVFCLSHGHEDHCGGFERVFEFPGNDVESENRIIIDELWVTARLFNEEPTCSSTTYLLAEAQRRLDLWKNDPDEANLNGNRLVVFGRSDFDDLALLPPEQRPMAGDEVTLVNGEDRSSDFEMFVHWPFRTVVDEDEEGADRNDPSLIVQVTVKDRDCPPIRLLLGGDAGCWIWETVFLKTKEKGNLEKLNWDVFVPPHHASYSFFTSKTGKEGRTETNEDPADSSLAVLAGGQAGGWIVCSSRPIREKNYKDGDPPHIQAVNQYRACAKAIGGQFWSLMENPTEEAPEPLILRLTPKGLQKKTLDAKAVVSATCAKAPSVPSRWG